MQNAKLLAGSFLIAALFLFPCLASAQTISIVSGNGQLACYGCEQNAQSFAPLVVQVNGSNGQPLANTPVTWVATAPNYSDTVTTTTGSNGQASFTFAPPPFFGPQYEVGNITATAAGASITFVETLFLPPTNAQTVPLNLSIIPPALSGQVGTTATTPIDITVYQTNVGPLPNVQVKLVPASSTGPSVSCATEAGQQPGTVLTDANGTAVCTPVFGGVIGTGSYSIEVGNYTNFGGSSFSVTAGPPALIKITAGNNQNVTSGTIAPILLTAEVTDLGGNPSNAAAVKWAVTEGVATLSKTVSTSASNGLVSTAVTPVSGPVQVTVSLASNAKVSAVFTVNVNIVVTGLTILSGNSQQAIIGAPFTEPLIVQVNDNSNLIQGANVSFTVTSGSATLSAATATTNAQGQAQVTVTAGATPGPVTVVASVKSGASTYSQTFDLTVNPKGALITAVTNAASFATGNVSPCSLATIFGTGLAYNIQGVAEAFIAPQMQVANVSVTFGGISAPILDVANVNNQQSATVQVPCELPAPTSGSSTTQMVVTVNGTASTPFNVQVAEFSPGIFQTVMADGVTRAVLVRPDGSFVSVSNPQNPAHPGETIRMFVTGLGQTTPALFTDEFDPLVMSNGTEMPQPLGVNATVVVGINNGGVPVTWAGYAYGMVGVYEVDFQVPSDAPAGNNIPFAIAVYQGNSLVFGNASLIPIQ